MAVEILNRQRKIARDRLEGLNSAFEQSMMVAGVGEREVAVMFVSDSGIRRLNSEWRGIDSATDCLSFPMDVIEGIEEGYLGDIAISLERAEAQGPIHLPVDVPTEKALYWEVLFLFVHSLLHLMGHDHTESVDTEKMEMETGRIMKELGLPDGD